MAFYAGNIDCDAARVVLYVNVIEAMRNPRTSHFVDRFAEEPTARAATECDGD